MLMTEWNMEDALAVVREEAMERGRAEGMEKGRAEGRIEEKEKFVLSLLTEGMPIETIARIAELPIEKVRAITEERRA